MYRPQCHDPRLIDSKFKSHNFDRITRDHSNHTVRWRPSTTVSRTRARVIARKDHLQKKKAYPPFRFGYGLLLLCSKTSTRRRSALHHSYYVVRSAHSVDPAKDRRINVFVPDRTAPRVESRSSVLATVALRYVVGFSSFFGLRLSQFAFTTRRNRIYLPGSAAGRFFAWYFSHFNALYLFQRSKSRDREFFLYITQVCM